MDTEVLLAIVESATTDLKVLATLAGGKRESFYRGANFNNADLRGQNLAGFDLSSATFKGARADNTTIVDEKFRALIEQPTNTRLRLVLDANSIDKGFGEALSFFALSHGQLLKLALLFAMDNRGLFERLTLGRHVQKPGARALNLQATVSSALADSLGSWASKVGLSRSNLCRAIIQRMGEEEYWPKVSDFVLNGLANREIA